jgi:hypothetical protein
MNDWVTDTGKTPLISKDGNCQGMVTVVTEEEVNDAIKNVNLLWNVLKAVKRFKKPISSKENSATSLNSMVSSSTDISSIYSPETPNGIE